MTRHRGTFDPTNPAPYELSRSAIETFVRCPACFWLEKLAGVKRPSTPPFTLNAATDELLKKDFDTTRGTNEPHPFLERHALGHLRPFAHPCLEKWRSSLHFGARDHFHALHAETGLLVGGGIDDLWEDTRTGVLHVVDYKSTASRDGAAPSLEPTYRASYKRQAELYQWVLRNMGFEVSPIAYFLYVDADRTTPGMLNETGDAAAMAFRVHLLEYRGEHDWIEPTLRSIRALLENRAPCPAHSTTGHGRKADEPCELGRYLDQVAAAS
ncbi:MAG: PD-(D/E)XK nuclease family protein [Pseudomonadales bacterium]|jgi:hypothetical protein|nr:PD-(D/E)XK nuclease family protein [Pseudomonadales bacterium]